MSTCIYCENKKEAIAFVTYDMTNVTEQIYNWCGNCKPYKKEEDCEEEDCEEEDCDCEEEDCEEDCDCEEEDCDCEEEDCDCEEDCDYESAAYYLPENLNTMKIHELKYELIVRNLSCQGTKNILIKRLEDDIDNEDDYLDNDSGYESDSDDSDYDSDS